MKRLFWIAASVLLFSGCAAVLPAPSPATTPETAASASSTASGPSSSTETASPETGSCSLPAELQAVDLPTVLCDEIRPVYHYALFDPPASGYYTHCRDGRWGLMRNDGSEILPCTFDAPIALCSDEGVRYPAWIARKETADEAFWNETQQYLASVGEGFVCDMAHCGPGYEYYFWDESCDQMFAYYGSLGPSDPTHISPGMQSQRGWWFPTRPGTLVEEDWGPGVQFDSTAPYRYRSAEGTPLNNYEYQQAELFYNGALLAAARRGDRWLYLDGSGNEVTAPVYDSIYETPWNDIGYASPLLNGYAAVCREGMFGLLDSSGTEYLPCAYDGLVWDGALGWLKLTDGWHAFRIASATPVTASPAPAQGDPLRGVPLTTVFPDTYPGNGRRVQYTTIRDDNLNVRAGPGTEYPKIGHIPPGSSVQELGTSSTVDGWTFVLYQDWLRGWVSSEYLE